MFDMSFCSPHLSPFSEKGGKEEKNFGFSKNFDCKENENEENKNTQSICYNEDDSYFDCKKQTCEFIEEELLSLRPHEDEKEEKENCIDAPQAKNTKEEEKEIKEDENEDDGVRKSEVDKFNITEEKDKNRVEEQEKNEKIQENKITGEITKDKEKTKEELSFKAKLELFENIRRQNEMKNLPTDGRRHRYSFNITPSGSTAFIDEEIRQKNEKVKTLEAQLQKMSMALRCRMDELERKENEAKNIKDYFNFLLSDKYAHVKKIAEILSTQKELQSKLENKESNLSALRQTHLKMAAYLDEESALSLSEEALNSKERKSPSGNMQLHHSITLTPHSQHSLSNTMDNDRNERKPMHLFTEDRLFSHDCHFSPHLYASAEKKQRNVEEQEEEEDEEEEEREREEGGRAEEVMTNYEETETEERRTDRRPSGGGWGEWPNMIDSDAATYNTNINTSHKELYCKDDKHFVQQRAEGRRISTQAENDMEQIANILKDYTQMESELKEAKQTIFKQKEENYNLSMMIIEQGNLLRHTENASAGEGGLLPLVEETGMLRKEINELVAKFTYYQKNAEAKESKVLFEAEQSRQKLFEMNRRNAEFLHSYDDLKHATLQLQKVIQLEKEKPSEKSLYEKEIIERLHRTEREVVDLQINNTLMKNKLEEYEKENEKLKMKVNELQHQLEETDKQFDVLIEERYDNDQEEKRDLKARLRLQDQILRQNFRQQYLNYVGSKNDAIRNNKIDMNKILDEKLKLDENTYMENFINRKIEHTSHPFPI